MTHEELYNLFEKVVDTVNKYTTYHCDYYCNNEIWREDGMGVSFEVHVHSDQGEGADWTEDWSIDSDGKIYAHSEIYNDFETFSKDWTW